MKSCKWCKPAAHIIGILVKQRDKAHTGTIWEQQTPRLHQVDSLLRKGI